MTHVVPEAAKEQGTGRKALPPCPITGRPAKRRVHGVSKDLLIRLWRAVGGGDLTRLYAGTSGLALYESDAGLFFFHPLIAGDEAFYRAFYGSFSADDFLSAPGRERTEFRHAGALVPAGADVLDVGCGPAGFRAYVPHATYHGIDPYRDADPAMGIRRDTPNDHAAAHPGRYDVVAAFQVIEHVTDPLEFARTLYRMVKPGGLLILCAPLHPSPLTDIPNFPISMPPHHLTWWTPDAFRVLAAALGAQPEEVSILPASPHIGPISWMHKLGPWRSSGPPDERYIGHRWGWHVNLAASFVLGRLFDRAFGPPRAARPIDVFLAARKPLAR
jgi:SAM-dependent methyltransferase